MSSLVKVSVVIPVYDGGRFIRDAVNSVLNQTFKDYEIIVVDDGSVDDTKEVLSSYGNRIKYIYQSNRGVSAARNRGIRASKGEYIAFLDQDDLWLPRKLELQVKYLGEHPTVGLVFSDTQSVAVGKLPAFDRRFVNKRAFQISRPHRGKVFRDLFVQNFVPTLTVVVRKICFDKVGLFDPSVDSAEDYDMWLRIARFFSLDYIDQPLATYRMHAQSLIHNVEKHLESMILTRKKMIGLEPSLLIQLSHQTMTKVYYRFYVYLGMVHMLKGDGRKSRKNYRQYIQLDPSDPRIYLLVIMTFLPFRCISKLASLAHNLNLDSVY